MQKKGGKAKANDDDMSEADRLAVAYAATGGRNTRAAARGPSRPASPMCGDDEDERKRARSEEEAAPKAKKHKAANEDDDEEEEADGDEEEEAEAAPQKALRCSSACLYS